MQEVENSEESLVGDTTHGEMVEETSSTPPPPPPPPEKGVPRRNAPISNVSNNSTLIENIRNTINPLIEHRKDPLEKQNKIQFNSINNYKSAI